MYVVEFQKRSLPHVHMLIWLSAKSKRNLNANFDSFVSAKIPDPAIDHVGYVAVKALMIHGPCGLQTKCLCMNKMKCTKHFPSRLVIHILCCLIVFFMLLYVYFLHFEICVYCFISTLGTMLKHILMNPDFQFIRGTER